MCIFSLYCVIFVFFFFFQAEDGIRDIGVTGVQTCALPISGVGVPDSRVVHSRFDTEGGREAMSRILADGAVPTGVFVVNDFTAIGAMGVLRDAGLVVGRDVAVVGFNDVPLAGSLPVGLTTVRSPMHEMGVRAAHLLMRRLGGEEVASERLVPVLVPRASTLGDRRA